MIPSALILYFKPRLLAILFLGFSGGLPLALTGATLSAWLFESGVDRAAIGFFAAVATPYALKFLWAPLVDGMNIPFLCARLGRRRGWLCLSQILTMASIAALAAVDPASQVMLTALCALLVAVASATQDIVIDAYRVELVPAEEQGAAAAMHVFGYRVGMLFSGAGALYLASWYSWQVAYAVMAALVGVGMIAALLAGEPEKVPSEECRVESEKEKNSALGTGHSPRWWLRQYVVEPFADFMRREHWLMILLFIVLYKFADAFIGVMTNPFLLDIGFAKQQIASIVKIYGFAATIVGSFAGAWMMTRFGMMRSLWLCGFGHALTNLMFVVQARAGADTHILALGITLENVTGGMGTAVFIAYIGLLCNRHFTATQYALLTSLAAFGRTWLSTPAGWVSEQLGWEGFFWVATLLAAPGLMVLWWLNREKTVG